MNKEPVWELLEAQDFVDKVFHINGHSEILKKLKPRNIKQLAAVLAIIRPSKRYLLNESWDKNYERSLDKTNRRQVLF